MKASVFNEQVIVVAFLNGKKIATKKMTREQWYKFRKKKSKYLYRCFQVEYYNRIFKIQ